MPHVRFLRLDDQPGTARARLKMKGVNSMLRMSEIQTLAMRPERAEKTVLTLYLDVDQSQQSNLNRGFERQLKGMLQSVRQTIESNNEEKAFNAASQRVEDFVARYHVGARGLTAVVDAADGFFWSEEIDFPIRNQIRWSREVFVQPLAVALDEYERIGIVLLDRANLRLFTMFLGEMEENLRETFDHRRVRHTKTVGMDHLGAADHAQRKADEQICLNLRHVTKDIDAMLEQHGSRRIILAGSPEITAELKAVLPKRLASQVIGVVDIATSATVEEIRSSATSIAEKFERDTEEALVTDLVTSADKSGRVVIGLGHTLHALNQRRVFQLVYADGFHSPGYECPGCAALFSLQAPSCSFCNSLVNSVEDVVERAVDHAIRRGVKVEVIRGEESESSLNNAGGIGAFLRTRTGSRRVS
jgi:Bacterial archaeo-eukaryotic release factor family 10